MANYYGTIGDDFYVGGPGDDYISGDAGKDVLAGGGGSDTLDGGAGDDILYSAALSPAWTVPPHWANNIPWTPPVLDTGSEVDTLQGGSGRDTIYAGYGDVIDGGADGADLLISLQGASAGVTADFRALANGGTLTIGGGLISNIIGLQWIEGSEFDDTLTGSNMSSSTFQFAPIYGRGGNDHLTQAFGTGHIYGGDGNDVIDATYDWASYFGEGGDDVILSRGGSAHAFGGDGNDTLNVAGHGHGGAGDDVITIIDVVNSHAGAGYGDAGDDQLNGAGSPDMLAGGEGADTIYGNGWTDVLFSAFSTDLLNTGLTYLVSEIQGEADNGTEHDQLFGGDQDDRLSIGYGDDADGGAGTNILALSLRGAGAGITLSTEDIIGGGTYVLGGGTIKNIHSVAVLWGSGFADSLTFAPQSTGVIVYGEGGDDVINATGGGDTIHGGAGADIINAGGGDDTIWIDAFGDVGAGEQINGGSGNDTLRTGFPYGGGEFDLTGATLTGIETIFTFVSIVTTTTLASVTALSGQFRFANGGVVSLAGNVTTPGSLFFSLSEAGNTINLTNVQASGFMQVYGQAGDDVITASPNGGDYYGGGGNDLVTGGAGFDFLYGNEGNDRLDGRGGVDQLTGGTGDDVYILDNSGDRVFENSGEGNDTIESSVTITAQNSANVETLKLTGAAAIGATGDGGANVLIGNGANNTLNGLGGADSMSGGAGDDLYFVDNAGDTVTENAGEGADEVRTSLASYSLFGTEIENLRAISNVAHDFRGSAGNNVITGGTGNDFIRLQDGGADTANGSDGNDVFLFGATLTAADLVDGGTGTDQLVLQGDYWGANALTLGTSFVSVENFAILPGDDTRFGDPGTNFYDYNVTTRDVNVAAGVQLVVDANRLRAGEDFTFNGSAEIDGSFFIYGGGGTNILTGGANNDVFLFGAQGQWGASDVVNGGSGGIDQLALRGNYTLTFGAGQLIGIENIGLLSAHDTRFGALGSSYSYDLTMVDANVAAGVQMTVDGAKLRVAEHFRFDGSQESNGSFKVFGGLVDDTIIGSQNGDFIQGNGGLDTLTGGGGADTFRYLATSDSTTGAVDRILDFTPGTDKIDLTRIDADSFAAGDQAFHWIGSNAFGATGAASAGELRAYQNGGSWFVEGDVNGDGIADLVIEVVSPTPLGAGDFLP